MRAVHHSDCLLQRFFDALRLSLLLIPSRPLMTRVPTVLSSCCPSNRQNTHVHWASTHDEHRIACASHHSTLPIRTTTPGIRDDEYITVVLQARHRDHLASNIERRSHSTTLSCCRGVPLCCSSPSPKAPPRPTARRPRAARSAGRRRRWAARSWRRCPRRRRRRPRRAPGG